MSVKVHHEYDPPGDAGVDCSVSPSLTQQEFKDECDINKLMARYVQTGVLPEGIGVGVYGDFSQGVDFQEAQQLIKRAEAQFMAMPANVRDRFANSPAAFLDFVSDEKNLDEAYKLGLLSDEYNAKRKAADAAPSPEPKPSAEPSK